MTQLLKQSTADTFRIGPFLDEDDGKTPETTLTIAQGDVQLSKAGAAYAQKNDATAATHDKDAWYSVTINGTDTGTLGKLDVEIHVVGALPVWKHFMVVPAVVFDALVAGSDNLQVHTVELSDNLITAAKIAANAITSAKIAADAIGNAQLADNAISAAKIAAGAITAAKIAAAAIGNSQLADGAISAAKIAANAIGNSQLANAAISAAVFAADAITQSVIADDAIGNAQLENNAIGSSKIAAGAIGAAQIAANAITAAKIAADAITASQIAAGAIGSSELADDAITAAKIATDAIGAAQLAAAAIVTATIADNALTKEKFPWVDANGRIDIGKILGVAATLSATTQKLEVDVASVRDDAAAGDATAANQTTAITHLTDIKGSGWVATDSLRNIKAASVNQPTKNVALDNFQFFMEDTNGDGVAGVTVTAQIAKDTGLFAACTNAVAEIGSGWYRIDLTAAEMNADAIALKFTATGALGRQVHFRPQPS